MREREGVTRRGFLQSLGAAAATVGVLGCDKDEAAAEAPPPQPETEQPAEPAPEGAHAVDIALTVNGERHQLRVEPRETLLGVLRQRLGITGPKRVCDAGSCGSCTVRYGDVLIYACSKLAVDAQAAPIVTVEGLAPAAGDADDAPALTPVQQAFVEKDAVQCGFCTPGFVMVVTDLLDENPAPSLDDVKHACAGNICRCGTYPRVFEAALAAAGRKGG